jgi:hypothetical protein
MVHMKKTKIQRCIVMELVGDGIMDYVNISIPRMMFRDGYGLVVGVQVV